MGCQVGILGAGLSGLACALELEKKGVEVTVFEQRNHVGGRVQTDFIDGFTLDHGFQVYLSSYEAGRYYFDYKDLGLGAFAPGARLIKGVKFSTISDPLRNPKMLFHTLLNPAASFKDKILILSLKRRALKLKAVDNSLNNKTTFQFLTDYGFSKKVINSFFKPFFAGIFLETSLDTPAGYFLYLFGKFSSGSATLPRGGMQSLAVQMQKKLKRKIVFGHKAKQISRTEIIFDDKNTYNFDYTVVATDVTSARNLGFSTEDKWNSVTTSYFKTKSEKWTSKYLYLNTSRLKIVNHVACLTSAQPSYGPKGWHLFSVNSVGQNLDSEEGLDRVTKDLESLFGKDELTTWEFIKSYYIKKALPANPKYGTAQVNLNGVYFCGDYLESPSIQGSLMSGYQLATDILNLQ